MRKVIGYRKAWPCFRNGSAGRWASGAAALEVEQGLDCVISRERCPDMQALRMRFLGKFGDGMQSRAKCGSGVHFSIATSRFWHSARSVECLLPSSVSGSLVPSTSGNGDRPAGLGSDLRASLLEVRRNSSLAVVSSFSDGGDRRDRRDENTEGCTSDESSRAVQHFFSQKDDVCDERAGLRPQDGTGNGPRESFSGHVGSNVDLSQTKLQRHWNEQSAQTTETARQWSLYLNGQQRRFMPHNSSGLKLFNTVMNSPSLYTRLYSSDATKAPKAPEVVDHSQRAVAVAIVCNFLVLALKVGVWIMTSSHVMLAEAVHSAADLANQGLLAYGLISSRRAPDALHPYGYSRERFVWSLISAVGIFCLGCGATIVHGVQNLATAEPLTNVTLAASVIAGSMVMEGASLIVAYGAVKKGAAAEGMSLREYLWRGHDPTSVAVLMEDGAACAGLVIAGMALATAEFTGNPMWDPIGSILVGNLLGVVAIFLIQRNRQALLGRSIDDVDMRRIINLLIADPVVEGLYDCKSEVIGPGEYRFKAEIDFNGVVIVQNYLQRAGRDNWMEEFRKAVNNPDGSVLDRVLAEYGEEVVSAVGCEVDRLEKDIQKLVPGIRHVDIEAHNPNGPAPREKFYLSENIGLKSDK
ncbi:hypothetical protein KC19_12G178400 [Ceratodon purpureus]|uniref:Cation efflux protein transmembrane domain-containing protein n=1 Tax=Ceratodon purpureus TaxID=3225 RepID=A0A8T0GA14_CERPU|nr:hypothetical protein KC19_12G178400 [Ceratodon purpureus]